MEMLQGVSYWYIDQCESKTNQLLTVLGFLHICGQPYFTHLMCGAFYRPGGTRAIQNDFALRIAAMPGRVSAAYLGRNQILALREKAEFALANEFSLAEFRAIILNSGSRPLGAVASDIDRWIASKAIARAESGTP